MSQIHQDDSIRVKESSMSSNKIQSNSHNPVFWHKSPRSYQESLWKGKTAGGGQIFMVGHISESDPWGVGSQQRLNVIFHQCIQKCIKISFYVNLQSCYCVVKHACTEAIKYVILYTNFNACMHCVFAF